MTTAKASGGATRDSVLRLLSGDEVARLSNVDTLPYLTVGDECLASAAIGLFRPAKIV